VAATRYGELKFPFDPIAVSRSYRRHKKAAPMN